MKVPVPLTKALNGASGFYRLCRDDKLILNRMSLTSDNFHHVRGIRK